MSEKEAKRVAALDALRGIAILMVIFFHTSVSFPPDHRLARLLESGNLGVQLFFLVSAITMCHMWRERWNEADRQLKFYIRRFFRIAPLFWLAMILYMALWGIQP